MPTLDASNLYNRQTFCLEAERMLTLIREHDDVHSAREALFRRVSRQQFDHTLEAGPLDPERQVVVRDCARAWRGMLRKRSDRRVRFSLVGALWDLARDLPRPDLGAAFYAEMIHLTRGVEGRAILSPFLDLGEEADLHGREAAIHRSRSLDGLWSKVESAMARFPHGLSTEAQERRAVRRGHLLDGLGAGSSDWSDWRWQFRHVVREPGLLARLLHLDGQELRNVHAACAAHLPFGVTPYYLSLMDDDPEAGRDVAVRAQVLPPAEYVHEMMAHHGDSTHSFDFMLERDTSPIDLVTRRYPAIAILKPYNTCPQICVYCQRNWEITHALASHALAPPEKLESACRWIEEHPAIRELLITGGDPLAMDDSPLQDLLTRIASIRSIDLIRLGTRIPVTAPMRVTEAVAEFLGSLRVPGQREICVVTHVEHPYEVTPDFVMAVERLRRQGIPVYNQLVYSFYVSRRFEACTLRMLLKRCGVDPYYTFAPKGKDETRSYRVPLARLLQEQREEARLLPGLRRTDEAVYNVPGVGKNHLRAFQHRDLLSILPDGARVYEFHPWEKGIIRRNSHIGKDIPILEYLDRLKGRGEDPADYESIWYYY